MSTNPKTAHTVRGVCAVIGQLAGDKGLNAAENAAGGYLDSFLKSYFNALITCLRDEHPETRRGAVILAFISTTGNYSDGYYSSKVDERGRMLTGLTKAIEIEGDELFRNYAVGVLHSLTYHSRMVDPSFREHLRQKFDRLLQRLPGIATLTYGKKNVSMVSEILTAIG